MPDNPGPRHRVSKARLAQRTVRPYIDLIGMGLFFVAMVLAFTGLPLPGVLVAFVAGYVAGK